MKLFDKKPESFLNSKNQTHWNCAYHQGERITNFCLSEQCLLPLCPQCVKVHIQEHSKMNLHGNFEVIEAVVENVKTELKSKLDRGSKMKGIVQHLSKSKDHQVQDIVANLRNFKQQLIRVINEHFRSIQEQIRDSLSKNQQKFKQQVQRNIVISKNLTQNSKKALQSLSGNQCMEAIINTFTDLKKKQNMLDQSCKKIQTQSLTKSVVTINRNCINEIIELIGNGVELTNIQIPQYQLINSINAGFIKQKKSQNIKNSLQNSILRGSLTELKIQNDPSFINEKFESKMQNGLIERLSKTTERLQNDLDNLKKNNEQNQKGSMFYA